MAKTTGTKKAKATKPVVDPQGLILLREEIAGFNRQTLEGAWTIGSYIAPLVRMSVADMSATLADQRDEDDKLPEGVYAAAKQANLKKVELPAFVAGLAPDLDVEGKTLKALVERIRGYVKIFRAYPSNVPAGLKTIDAALKSLQGNREAPVFTLAKATKAIGKIVELIRDTEPSRLQGDDRKAALALSSAITLLQETLASKIAKPVAALRKL